MHSRKLTLSMDVSGFSSAAIPTPKDIVQTCAVILFSQFDFSYKYLQILNFILKLMNFCFLVLLTHRVQQQPFNGLFSRKTWVSRYQKGKTNLDFTGARDSEWLWHHLGHMQVCTSLQTDNHASTPPLSFYRPDALPAAQPTASKHWRHNLHIG